jgi:hypothetical protein
VTRGYDNAHLLADLERKLPLRLLAARCVDPAGDAAALRCPLDEAHVSHHERTYMMYTRQSDTWQDDRATHGLDRLTD